ncbi:hypothetical protein J23TS9_08940 [Paenibacillus sp. J23TS9]|uniref:PepSY1/2 domain-containing protein n=1 Tax=Paenibacillus sp. J23TS9 TaxID=2807193 RepID=UPI001B26FBF7|nr:PepSY1/2 domain-containing protein [Paenibacillus sp. J23TS9]GIP25764.1 hypothetical protein J23TS9_08940 [Paenibacillus sp. J23TS9]
MNQARRTKMTTLLIAFLLIGIIIYGYMKHKELKQELDQLQSEKLNNTRLWFQLQMMNTETLDFDLANVLSSNSAAYRQKYLKAAYESASFMTNMNWYTPTPTILYDFQSNRSGPFWSQTASYLGYLVDDSAETLTEVQRQNVLKMRNFILKTAPALHQINDSVLYGPHVKNEVPSEELSRRITSLTNELDSNPLIGDKEPLFNEYLYHLNPYQPQVQAFKKEVRVHKEELQSKVESFMNVLWKDKRDKQVMSSGGGITPEFGDSLDFLSGNGGNMFYNVQISVAGGHILRIYPTEDGSKKSDNRKITKAEAIKLAQSFVKSWGEAPLVIDNTFAKGTLVDVTFVPQVGGVPYTDANVVVTIDTATGVLQNFDTTGYYLKRDRIVKTNAGIPPETALKQVNAELTVTDRPHLMIRKGKLVYSIPVKGYEQVTNVYVDAQTGKQADIEYKSLDH